MLCVCKYTPVEMLAGFGIECRFFDETPADFNDCSASVHPNLCGFSKAFLQAADPDEDVLLVNCCDSMRRTFEIAAAHMRSGTIRLLDLPHCATSCAIEKYARDLKHLKDDLARTSGQPFDEDACLSAFTGPDCESGDYAALLGVRAGSAIETAVADALPFPVKNLTCVGNRNVAPPNVSAGENPAERRARYRTDEGLLWLDYAAALLGQTPCARMVDTAARRQLFDDPHLKAIVYHTVKFCDFYGSEYAAVKKTASVPLLKIESDCTAQSQGQLSTRIEAFAESLAARTPATENDRSFDSRKEDSHMNNRAHYVAGIDSGSTSTDIVILDRDGTVTASIVVATGGGARKSADDAFQRALDRAGITRADIGHVVSTGYGRSFIESDRSITEISCHAKGAVRLCPAARTIIDIGGQDSKVICLDDDGAVKNFVMNDKCAAGTGRFLEMMARALGLTLAEAASIGLDWKEDIVISNMCTVFAESEIVSLVAQNKAVGDIVHGLNQSVASKTASLVRRAQGSGPCLMTGGVAKNKGVVAAIEEKTGMTIVVSEQSQQCGALGAALFAWENLFG